LSRPRAVGRARARCACVGASAGRALRRLPSRRHRRSTSTRSTVPSAEGSAQLTRSARCRPNSSLRTNGQAASTRLRRVLDQTEAAALIGLSARASGASAGVGKPDQATSGIEDPRAMLTAICLGLRAARTTLGLQSLRDNLRRASAASSSSAAPAVGLPAACQLIPVDGSG
jgi:hypothetical protein